MVLISVKLLWKMVAFFYRDAARVQDTFMTYEVYTDNITMQLVTEACKMLGKALSLLKSLVWFWVASIYKKCFGYSLLMCNFFVYPKSLSKVWCWGSLENIFLNSAKGPDMIICCAPLEEICLSLWRIWTHCMVISLFPTRSSERDIIILIIILRRISIKDSVS